MGNPKDNDRKILKKYVPLAALDYILGLIKSEKVLVKIKHQRVTKHGDYRPLSNGGHQITVNNNLNPYSFLITLVHEMAHLQAFTTYGRNIKPHGMEWKITFQKLMLPVLNAAVFPNDILPVLAHHLKNPKASSDTDLNLNRVLRKYNPPSDKQTVEELPEGSLFRVNNGKVYKKMHLRRTRILCTELASGKQYLFHPSAEVIIANE